jgi:hypothetical protein
MKNQKSNPIKYLVFILFAVLIVSIGHTQTITPTNIPITPGGFFDKVYDKDGRVFNLENLAFKGTGGGQNGTYSIISSTCQAGFFVAHFANGSGMTSTTNTFEIACRNTVCQVLENISGLLGWNGTWPSNGYVHILVDDISQYVPTPNTSGVLGLASAYYANPANPASAYPGIARNQVQKTIQSKVNAWTNVYARLPVSGNGFYHAYMAFNFVNSSFNWNPDYSNIAGPTQLDLYTVILHEITHGLGFASLISASGLSKFGAQNNYYSDYDRFLYNGSNVKLLTSNGCSQLYGLAFNSNTLVL